MNQKSKLYWRNEKELEKGGEENKRDINIEPEYKNEREYEFELIKGNEKEGGKEWECEKRRRRGISVGSTLKRLGS